MKHIEEKLNFIRDLLSKAPAGAQLALATYTAEEFAELRPGDDYADFKREERVIAERLIADGISGSVQFVPIDSVGYYRFIGQNNMNNNEASRAAYAAHLAQKNTKG